MANILVRGQETVVAQLMRARYHEKVAAMRRHLESVGLDLSSFVVSMFPGNFEGTMVSKQALIQGLLDDELPLDHWAFLRSKLRNFAHLTDRRHPEEYALDLALGWISEEWLRHELDFQAGRPGAVVLIGVDAAREYSSLTIRATADFAITKNDLTTRVDLMVDFHGTWASSGYIDLKKGKVGHLVNATLDAVLGFDVQNSSFHVVQLAHLAGRQFASNAAMGGNQTMKVPVPISVDLKYLLQAL